MNETEKILYDIFNDPVNIILNFLCKPDPSLRDACKYGYYEKVEAFIEKRSTSFNGGSALNDALANACLYGHIGIAKLLIYNCNSEFDWDWNRGLACACHNSRNMEIILLMISYGADDWNRALACACESGNMDAVQLMIEYGANEWNYGLDAACRGGYTEIAKLMIEKGAEGVDWALKYACSSGNLDTVNLLIEHGTCKKGSYYYNLGLKYACKSGNMSIINLMVKYGANDYIKALEGACLGGNIKICLFVIEKLEGICDYSDWGLKNACDGGHIDILNLMIRQGADWDLWIESEYDEDNEEHQKIYRRYIRYRSSR